MENLQVLSAGKWDDLHAELQAMIYLYTDAKTGRAFKLASSCLQRYLWDNPFLQDQYLKKYLVKICYTSKKGALIQGIALSLYSGVKFHLHGLKTTVYLRGPKERYTKKQEFRYGKPIDRAVLSLADNVLSETYSRKKCPSGHYMNMYYHPNGMIKLAENMKGALRHGQSIAYHGDGREAHDKTYCEDKPHGIWLAWYPGSYHQIRLAEQYKHGRRVGHFARWYENGLPMIEANYADEPEINNVVPHSAPPFETSDKGCYHGPVNEYWPNGLLIYSSNWINGQLHGYLHMYGHAKVLFYKGEYWHGMATGVHKILFPDGRLSRRHRYENGNYVGVQTVWHEDGYVASEQHFKYYSQHGLSMSWYENGMIETVYNYDHGELHGRCRHWTSDGTLDHDHIYVTGIRAYNVLEYWYGPGL